MDGATAAARRRHRALFVGAVLLTVAGSALGRAATVAPAARWAGLTLAVVGVVGMFVAGIRALVATVRVRSGQRPGEGPRPRATDDHGDAPP